MDSVISIILFVVSILTFISCSKPKTVEFNRWIKVAHKRLRKTRRKDEHIRAAVLLRVFDRKTQSLLLLWQKRQLYWVVLSIAFLFYLYLIVYSSSKDEVWMKAVPIIFFTALCFIMALLKIDLFNKLKDDNGDREYTHSYLNELKEVPLWLTPIIILACPIAFAFGTKYRVFRKNERFHLLIGREKKFELFLVFTIVVCVVLLIHKLFISVLILEPLVFYPLIVITGPSFYHFIYVISGALIGFTVPGQLNGIIRSVDRIGLAHWLLISSTVSLVLYYSSSYENTINLLTGSPWIVYVNVICDLYIIIRFKKITRAIIVSRRVSNSQSFSLIHKYLLFIFESFIAAYFTIYFAFKFSGELNSHLSSIRLLVGLQPDGSGLYVGPSFFLFHTTLIPAVAILSIPILLIFRRVLVLFFNRVVVVVLRSGQPAVYISAIIVFLASGADMIYKLLS